MDSQLKILFQDEALVAIDKPAGLLVHRSRIDAHATEFALQRLRDQLGQPVFPVHRIDRPTSGVLLFALSSGIAQSMCEQFESRSTSKVYHAIVRGHPPANGTWSEPLIERRDETTDRLARTAKPAQDAITEFETMRSWVVPFSTGKYPHSRYSLVRVRPRTGRRHQIRRHFNHMAYPVIGDSSHGDRRHNRLFRVQFGIRRLLLVAKQLSFRHPLTGAFHTVEADVGEEFEAAVFRLDQEYGILLESNK